MFGELAVLYLFLGGVGAGALVVCSLIDLLWVRRPFGTAACEAGLSVDPAERIVDYGLAAGLLALVVGVASLAFDLGRIDRAASLFLSPSFTLLTAGSYALALLTALGGFAVLVRFVYLPAVPRAAVVAAEASVCVAGAFVALYTGLLLQTVGGVAFWASPFVPALFVLSSLSCGVAIVLAAAFFVDSDARSNLLLRRLVRADVAVIVLEAVCAAAFLLTMRASANPGAAASVEAIAHGAAAPAWWIGFCLCGLAGPLALEAVGARHAAVSRTAFAVAALLVLVGGACLRWSIVEAGGHRPLALEQPVADAAGAPAWTLPNEPEA